MEKNWGDTRSATLTVELSLHVPVLTTLIGRFEHEIFRLGVECSNPYCFMFCG